MGLEQEKEYIQIPEQLLADADNEQVVTGDTENGENATRDFMLNFAEETAKIFYSSLDESWKKQGLSGFSVKTDDLSRLTVLTAKQHIPEELLEQSPGAALALILSAEFGRNYIEKRRKDKQKKEEKENSEKTAEND